MFFSGLPQSQPITIEFSDLTFTVLAPRRKGQLKHGRKTILDGVSGEFVPGQLTAIMGPSGAGKSTLLNVLAGHKVRGVEGRVAVNGAARSLRVFRKQQAYILQQDVLLPYLTADECMMAAAALKLAGALDDAARRQLVDDVLESLGLSACRKTRCHQLSGGQRRRLSIALELLNNPPVMFFDEPTSGLDSNSCSSCVSLLKNLAEGGRTVICTIHQPSSRLFQLFDQLYVLAAGSCIYRGARASLVPALAAAGLHCPEYYNPADFVIEAACGEYGDWTRTLVQAAQNGRSTAWIGSAQQDPNLPSYRDCVQAGEEPTTDGRLMEERDLEMKLLQDSPSSVNGTGAAHTADQANVELSQPAVAPLSDDELNSSSLLLEDATHGCRGGGGGPADPAQSGGSPPKKFRASTWVQFCVLLKRTMRSILRDQMLTSMRLVSHVLFGLLIGSLYFRIGNEASDVYNNAAQLFFALLFVLFSSLMPTILTFPLEMAVFKKEYMNCWYSAWSYYMAKTAADLPFQIVFPLIYDVIVYLMTSQPLEFFRFGMFCLMTVLTALVAQSIGLVIGACCGIQLAVFMGPITMIPVILFSGFFVNLSRIPVWLSWISYLSYARYAFQGLMLSVYGYGRADMHCSLPYCYFKSPAKFLKEMDMLDADYWTSAAVLAGMTVGLRLTGYLVLRLRLAMER